MNWIEDMKIVRWSGRTRTGKTHFVISYFTVCTPLKSNKHMERNETQVFLRWDELVKWGKSNTTYV